MVLTKKSKPAPPGVVTGRRLYFIEQVSQGRVRWLIGPGEAIWFPQDPDLDPEIQTPIFLELVVSGWAYVEPWDDDEDPPPQESPCSLTAEGWNVLIEARQRAKRRNQR